MGDLFLGFFSAALASVMGPLLLEAILGHELSARTAAVVFVLSAALGGFVGGMLSHQGEWLRGMGVGILLVAYQQWRASLPGSETATGLLAASALPAAVLGALVSTWAAGPGRQRWWGRVGKKAGTLIRMLRVIGAFLAVAVLLAPSSAAGVMAIGVAGLLLFLFGGFLRVPVQTVAIFMEDKCRSRARQADLA